MHGWAHHSGIFPAPNSANHYWDVTACCTANTHRAGTLLLLTLHLPVSCSLLCLLRRLLLVLLLLLFLFSCFCSLTFLLLTQAADAEVVRLQQGAEGLKQERQKGLIETRKATQQWAVAQADLRSTRHQLKVLQSQVPLLLLILLVPPLLHVGGFFFFFSLFSLFFMCR